MRGPPTGIPPRETFLSALVRRVAALIIAVVTILVLVWYLGWVDLPDNWFTETTPAYNPDVLHHSDDGVTTVAKVEGEAIYLYDGSEWHDTSFMIGANLGESMPGYSTGDSQLGTQDYKRWFSELQSLDVTLIRVAQLQQPSFYAALSDYNAFREVPIFVMHGIGVPVAAMYEESLANDEAGADAFNYLDEMRDNIGDAVRAVHGDLGSSYNYNVSRYVVGWVVGTEWDVNTVTHTNDVRSTVEPYEGSYIVASPEASPFESWLAELLDYVVTVEMEYDWQRPCAFLNSPATDPLTHPTSSDADVVSIDPTHMNATLAFAAGYFAAYSAFPYTPDFLKFEYSDWETAGGIAVTDQFGAYLYDLAAHHEGFCIVLAESGVPSSIGVGYTGPDGRSQGNLTEYEQAGIIVDIVHGAQRGGFAAAFAFDVTDQWERTTWNTRHQELPASKRAFWYNALSANQGSGIFSVEPETSMVLDGQDSDWAELGKSQVDTVTANALVTSVTHDGAFLHLLIKKSTSGSVWRLGEHNEEVFVAFDTSPGLGSRTPDVMNGIEVDFDVDTVLHVHENGANMYINKGIDWFTRYYEPVFANMKDETYFPSADDFPDPADGEFALWRMPVSYPIYREDTAEMIDEEVFKVGRLLEGEADTEDGSTFDNRATYQITNDVMEIRIPYMMLGIADPSSHQSWEVQGYSYDANVTAIDNVANGVILEALLNDDDIEIASVADRPAPITHTWSEWSKVCFCERRKLGYEVLHEVTDHYSMMTTTDTPVDSVVSGSGSTAVEDGFDYCACGTSWPAESDDGLIILYQVFACAVAALVIFYLYSKVLKDPLRAATDEEYAAYKFFSLLPCLRVHPRLKRRLWFFSFYGLVIWWLLYTDFWILRELRELAGSIQGTTPCIYLAVVNTEALVILFATFMVEWPPEPRPYPSGYNPMYHTQIKRAALLITCHHSADRIEQTLQAALGTFEPHQIFVCDNGRSMHPLDNTREICIRVSDAYYKQEKKLRPETQWRPINYIWIPEGSKIVATFYVLEHYVQEQHFDYVMTIDDDVLITEHLWIPFDHFKDLRVQALAFTIRAENNTDPDGSTPPLNYVQRLQDFEYKLAGLIKLFQTYLGTCLFCHGAVGFWKREALHKVLERHDSMHMGDDLQEGLILHGLDDPLILNGLRGGYKILAVGDVSVGTQVPHCWYHAHDFGKFMGQMFTGLMGLRVGQAVAAWSASARKCRTNDPRRLPTHRLRRLLHQRDMDPSGSRKKLISRLEKSYKSEGGGHKVCEVKGCKKDRVCAREVCSIHGGYGCGEPSLFTQRVMGWDCTEQRFVLKFIEIALKALVVCNKQTWFVMSMMLGQLYLVITDWLRIPIVLLFVLAPNSRWTFLAGLVVAWAFQVLVLLLFNELLLKRRKGLEPLGIKRKTIIFFPVYKMLMSVVLRSAATLYNALYYALVEDNKMQLQKRRVFKCTPPFTEDYRCRFTHDKWTEGVFASIMGTRAESVYLWPYYYYCWRAHLPPGPMTIGSDAEKRAYTEHLKSYAVCADFPDTKKQLDNMQEQIEKLFGLVEKLQGQKVDKPMVPPTPSFKRGKDGKDGAPAMAQLGSSGPGLRSAAPRSMHDQATANEAGLDALSNQLDAMGDAAEVVAAKAHVNKLRSAHQHVSRRVQGITGPPNDLKSSRITGPPNTKESTMASQRIIGPPSTGTASASSGRVNLLNVLSPGFRARANSLRVNGPPSAQPMRGMIYSQAYNGTGVSRVNGPPSAIGGNISGPPSQIRNSISGPPSGAASSISTTVVNSSSTTVITSSASPTSSTATSGTVTSVQGPPSRRV